ncbi:MAG: TRAP transporter small permease subunit [Cyanobacteria bacterium P01_A01_bin.123]
MSVLLSIAVWIDRINDWIGKFTFFLTLVMVVVGAYNAITRSLSKYIGVNFSSNLYIEVQWYLFSLVFLLGAAYVLKQGEHVRVDILYSRLSRKGKAWVDLFGSCVLLLPVCGLIVFYAIPAVSNSWKILEQSSDPSGLPRYPLKTMIPLAFVLLGLQGISEAIKQIAILLDVETERQEISR